MKKLTLPCLAAAAMLAARVGLCGTQSSTNYTALSDAADAGGGRAASASYTADTALGSLGAAADAGPDLLLKSGFVGQLTDVTNLAVTAATAAIDEGATNALAGIACLDDGTLTVLDGNEIAWLSPAFPVGTLSAAGSAATLAVFADSAASVTGRYFGVSGAVAFVVRNSDPDNFGTYAGDGLPDAWQARWFGVGNPDAAPHANPDHDAYDNAQEHAALTDPTNAASFFAIAAVSHSPAGLVVSFGPTSAARAYRLLYTSDLSTGNWTELPGSSWAPGAAGAMALADTTAAPSRFYRVAIRVP